MRILAISDIYEDLDLIEKLKRTFNEDKVDIVIVAGGIGFYNEQRKETYFENATKIFNSLTNIGDLVLYIPGGTDLEGLKVQNPLTINIDKDVYLFQKNEEKVGFFGLGGVNRNSIKSKNVFPYSWKENIVSDNYLKKLKVSYEKLETENPDYFILITHSPPYRYADYSKKISINTLEILEEAEQEDKETKEKTSSNPIHLGSKVLRKFLTQKIVNVHIFGHVNKRGGSRINREPTSFFNVSHLSSEPYKLTGRKYLLLELSNGSVLHHFDSLVDKDLRFEEFLNKYL